MQWYSYSKNSDFDKLRSTGHCYDGDYGGFEYEYCFAEYEYRFASTASLSTTRTARPNLSRFSTFFVPYVVRKTQAARVHPPHPPTPSPPLGGEGELRKVEVTLQALHKRFRGFLCVFSSLREPSGQDGACFLRLAPLLPLGR